MRYLSIAAICIVLALFGFGAQAQQIFYDADGKVTHVFATAAEKAYGEGNHQAAFAGFDRAVKLLQDAGYVAGDHHNLTELLVLRAGARFGLGRRDEAAAELLRLLKGGEINILFLGRLPSSAIVTTMSHRLEQWPDDTDALALRAAAYENERNTYDLALADRTRVIDLARTDADLAKAYDERSWPLRLSDRHRDALADLNRAIELDPQENYFSHRAFVHKRLGDADGAIADIGKAMQLSGASGRFYLDLAYRRAELYEQTGRLNDASLDVNNILLLKPDHSEAQGLRIVVLHRQGDDDQALKLLETLKRDDPKRFSAIQPKIGALVDLLQALEQAKYMIPDVAGKAWNMGKIVSTVPLAHLFGRKDPKIRPAWNALSDYVKQRARVDADLPSDGLAPLPQFSGDVSRKLIATLEFIDQQQSILGDALAGDMGDYARNVLALSSASHQLQALTLAGVKGAGDRFSEPVRDAAQAVALPEDIWRPFLMAAESQDKARTKETWSAFRQKFARLLEHNTSKTKAPAIQAARQIRTRHILIDSEEKALSLLAQLNGGADFAELAKQHSIDKGSGRMGGDLGFFGRGVMVKPFEDAAFALKPGEISRPFKTQFGWHIVKLEEEKF